ncbi:NADH-quinone oxidoreductase subunit NuoE [Alkalibacter saccharofermentans]|uniref:NADH-quinone oxidoreductase subunit E n=1 Tax=Alkalibacter saccharofermentans DSM 14828 TaxID=1120975 RepID=A0A1M4T3A0_9FIRM|nr:NADH-quinone oxidoreductase subunit NuoE [Alkalibacter saccharofermentans]SHE38946.1 NADH-quinone oxidoreductase subunit E [Alkalibacter saccharofermentans DSM 14828]
MDCCGAQDLKSRFNDIQVDLAELDMILAKYKDVKGSLITILQKAQDVYGYLSLPMLDYIAEVTKVNSAKVYGVATFYTQFRLEPVGENLVMLCQGTACHVNGAKTIEEAIVEELGVKEGETTPDGLFTLNNVACLGCCSLSPVMMINGETYGNLTPQKTKEILKQIKTDHEAGKEA